MGSQLDGVIAGIADGTCGRRHRISGNGVAARSMASLLYGISALDPVTLGSASIALIAIAFAACALPAQRAARIDHIAGVADGIEASFDFEGTITKRNMPLSSGKATLCSLRSTT
jgi:hypothetical protein